MSKVTERKSNRAGNQVCPLCSKSSPLVEHHIHGREIQSANATWNIAWICATCHDKVHIGKIIVEGWFASTSESGRSLVWHNEGEPSITGKDALPNLYIGPQGNQEVYHEPQTPEPVLSDSEPKKSLLGAWRKAQKNL